MKISSGAAVFLSSSNAYEKNSKKIHKFENDAITKKIFGDCTLIVAFFFPHTMASAM